MRKPSDFVSSMKEVSMHLARARDILSRGPLDYYFEKLVEHSEALLHQYAPLKVGQAVVISGNVECTHGWKGRERTLAVGATGTISDVDFANGQFWFDFVPDHEWWTDHDGTEHEAIRPHSYRLSEHVLAASDEPSHADSGDGIVRRLRDGSRVADERTRRELREAADVIERLRYELTVERATAAGSTEKYKAEIKRLQERL